MIDGEQRGPFELEELPGAGVRPSTYIWCKGKDNWEKAEDDADVCRLFRNRLYDLMHPAPAETENPFTIGPSLPTDEGTNNQSPTRFDHYLKDQPDAHIPTLEEIDSLEDTERPPMPLVSYAWLVTIFCCPPTGIVAIIFANKSKKAWKDGLKKEAHEYSRAAKMWTGISLFLGFIVYAFLLAFL